MRKWFKHKSVQYIIFIFIFFLIIIIGGVIFNRFYPDSMVMNCQTQYFATFSDSDAKIGLTYARTSQERSKGLMFVEKMSDDAGMYFVFEDETFGGFWMKNTLIPLDMIFIDSFMKIVDINADAQPCGDSECLTYIPNEKYQYVLEINGGLSEEFGIKVGDQVKIVSETDCPDVYEQESL